MTAMNLSPDLLPLPVAGPIHGPAHRRRRDALAKAVLESNGQANALVIVGSGVELIRNRDSTFPFRFHSDFYYLTGFPEPEAWLMMVIAANGDHQDLLFCRPRDPERETWDGVRVGPDRAAQLFHMDRAHPHTLLDEEIKEHLKNCATLVLPLSASAEMDQRTRGWMDQARSQARGGITAPHQFLDAGELVASLRLIKDEAERQTMAQAAAISAAAHVRAMQSTRPGLAEYEIEAGLLADFRRAGSQSVAYASIVASGPHSCILHHRAGDRRMQDGEMLLIDAGCELDGYASDITRSFPVSGRFSQAQADCYGLVLAAQEAAIEATCPGAAFTEPHDAAVRVLAQGMLDLHLLQKQSVDAAIESGAYRRFYMHRTGHWLGLDVHDVGDYRRRLSPGMVLTIEPGLYIQPATDIPEAFWNIGIRIEDDAVVTPKGCDLLTRGVPVAIDAIEDLMAQACP
jgi:Xaa-Pro aminopeptidase